MKRTRRPGPLAVPGDPAEVITDRAPALANVIEDLVPAAWHNTGQYENNRVECDHGRLKARLRPMRGLRTERTTSVVIQGHAFIQTCVVANTSLQPTPRGCSGWPPHSTNPDRPSDQHGPQVPPQHGLRSNNATAPLKTS